MPLTPQDIQEKAFSVKYLRGFDIEEVDLFLEEVAENLYVLIQENKRLSEQVKLLERNNQEFREQEKALRDAVLSARRVADGIIAQSRQEAANILDRARETLNQSSDGQAAEKEIEALVGLKTELRATLKQYLRRLDEPVAAHEPEPASFSSLPVSGPKPRQEDPDDLSDLYQKIKLPPEPEPAPAPDPAAAAPAEPEASLPGTTKKEPKDSAGPFPCIEEDPLFSGGDLLADHHEPAVTFDDEEPG